MAIMLAGVECGFGWRPVASLLLAAVEAMGPRFGGMGRPDPRARRQQFGLVEDLGQHLILQAALPQL